MTDLGSIIYAFPFHSYIQKRPILLFDSDSFNYIMYNYLCPFHFLLVVACSMCGLHGRGDDDFEPLRTVEGERGGWG